MWILQYLWSYTKLTSVALYHRQDDQTGYSWKFTCCTQSFLNKENLELFRIISIIISIFTNYRYYYHVNWGNQRVMLVTPRNHQKSVVDRLAPRLTTNRPCTSWLICISLETWFCGARWLNNIAFNVGSLNQGIHLLSRSTLFIKYAME